ncbi:hypothetical protein WR25_07834 [Diploscapter pachys]|uniref:Bis(5'-nucleosyl)-tetraphosphatase [asymmetrical] n=1 Tax=Diploscapter pachys TaxID=2018661 RepID=A0A2A2JF59_9BILA|nr:hypothetical protein WR25_07834 [Diploscapter pachys]
MLVSSRGLRRKFVWTETANFSTKAAPTAAELKRKQRTSLSVYGCGLAATGALGIAKFVMPGVNKGIQSEVVFPRRVQYFNIRDIRRISCGFGFSLFASADKLYGSGLNNLWQIAGHFHTEATGQEYYISPKRITLPSEGKIVSISSGRAHSLVAFKDGSVYAFGDNNHGQCGVDPEQRKTLVGQMEERLPSVEIPSTSKAIAVHCSLDTSFVLTESGEVFAFGLNEDGQCANGRYGIQPLPAKILGDAEGERIIGIAGSTDTIMALSDRGDVFIWGQSEYGQAGMGNTQIQLKYSTRIPLSLGKITSIGSTAFGCIVANEQGEVYVWGAGIVGMGPNMQKTEKPVKLDQPLFENRKVRRVYAGNCAMAVINDEDRAFIWGQNRLFFILVKNSEMSAVVRAAGLVVYRKLDNKTQFLLLQASYPPHHWTPPKGHVDPGEDEWIAALRETKEEAGIDSKELDIHKDCHETLRYTAHNKPKSVKYWLARLKNPEDVQLSHEHQNHMWAELDEAVSIADYAEMGALLKKFATYIKEQNK